MNTLKLRWSDGHSFAVEFCADSPAQFSRAATDALLDCRLHHSKTARLELHVRAGDYWINPHLINPQGPIEAFGRQILGRLQGHVINLPNWPADATDIPLVRGTDYVLVVGPDNWHSEIVFDACLAASHYMRNFNSFVAGVVETIEAKHETNQDQDRSR